MKKKSKSKETKAITPVKTKPAKGEIIDTTVTTTTSKKILTCY